jgi:uncharacterized protein (DUF983 family)
MHDSVPTGDAARVCPLCGRRPDTTANRVGRGFAVVMIVLIGVIAIAPLLWAARVCAEWAMGI